MFWRAGEDWGREAALWDAAMKSPEIKAFRARAEEPRPDSQATIDAGPDAMGTRGEMAGVAVRRLAFRLIEKRWEMRHCAVRVLGKNL